MQTIKTGVVVALLLAVCYGAFVALNAPEPELPDSIREWASTEGELDSLVDLDLGLEMPGEPSSSNGLVAANGQTTNASGSQSLASAIAPASMVQNSSMVPNSTAANSSANAANDTAASSLAPGSALPQIPPLSSSLTGAHNSAQSTTPTTNSSMASPNVLSVPKLPSDVASNAANSRAASTQSGAASTQPNANALATSLSLPTAAGPSNNTSGFPALNNSNLSKTDIPASGTPGNSSAASSTANSSSLPSLDLPNLEMPTPDIQSAMSNLAANSQAAIADAQKSIENSAQNTQTNLSNQLQGAMNQLGNSANAAKNSAQNAAQQAIEQAKNMQAGLAANTESLIPDAVNSMASDVQNAVGALASQVNDGSQKVKATLAGRQETTTPSGSSVPTAKFAVVREQALAEANRGELKDALTLLTPYFGSPELGYEETSDLVDILDALSREVVYSQRHLLEPPHVVRPTDTVASVAEQYSITPEFLTALNGLGDSKALVPGSKLKVVQGPVNAHVSLQRQELTLFVGGLYAGRFPVSFGKDPAPKPGVFEVVDRQTKRTYYGLGANVLQPNDPRNPYGGYWINLGDDLCVHGTAEMASSELKDAGCISLAPLDAKHVYSILNRGSQVTVAE